MGPTNVVNNDIVKILGKIAINPCGDFDAARNYERLDLVSYMGGTYLCIKKPTENELPTDEGHWMKMTKDGSMGVDGVQGVQGSIGIEGDVWMPIVDADGWLRWVKKPYDSLDEPKEFMLIQEIEYYGWTKSAEPEITAEYKDNPAKYIADKNPQLLEGIVPNSLFDRTDASDEMPYIWRRTNKNKNWECVDAKYVEAKVAQGISSVVINTRLTYGAVTVDTDLSWMVFPSGSGGTSWTAQDGIKFTPNTVINGGGGSSTGELYMTMERWDRRTKKCELTNEFALQQIFDAIKHSDPVSGFDWGTFANYYSDSTVPFSPFILKFTNGIFTIQDVHNLSTANRMLNGIELNGSLSIFNSVNSFMQGSHKQMGKYRVDAGMKIFLKSSGCSMTLGNSTVTTLPNAL